LLYLTYCYARLCSSVPIVVSYGNIYMLYKVHPFASSILFDLHFEREHVLMALTRKMLLFQ
jgi:hypothetical protein